MSREGAGWGGGRGVVGRGGGGVGEGSTAVGTSCLSACRDFHD